MDEVPESTHKGAVINQGREGRECENKKILDDSNYENAQGTGVSNMACHEEISKTTNDYGYWKMRRCWKIREH